MSVSSSDSSVLRPSSQLLQPEFPGVVHSNVSVPNPNQGAQNASSLENRVMKLKIEPHQEEDLAVLGEESSEDEGDYSLEEAIERDDRDCENNPKYRQNPVDGRTPTISPRGPAERFTSPRLRVEPTPQT